MKKYTQSDLDAALPTLSIVELTSGELLSQPRFKSRCQLVAENHKRRTVESVYLKNLRYTYQLTAGSEAGTYLLVDHDNHVTKKVSARCLLNALNDEM